MSLFRKPQWDTFFEEKIFTDKKYIIDVGGGLRIDPNKNNRRKEHHWLDPYVAKVKYVILDKVADYHPDLVGDIHNLTLPDNSVDAMLCINLFEHLEEPQKAVREAYRVLKPGGYLYIDVPFLFYYHPMEGYYKDFFRFTKDGLEYMTKDFSSTEIQNVRGAISTVFNLFPFFTKKTRFFDALDILFKKSSSNQTSCYRVFCVK